MRVLSLLALLVVAVWAAPSQAQLPRIPLPGGIKLPEIGIDALLKEEPPLTTGLADALISLPELDRWEPPLAKLPEGGLQTKDGAFVLPGPGRYHFSLQSYCLRAGTHGPGQGEGYLHAPLKGARAEIIRGILRRSVEHPELDQHQVQLLLWAVLARTNLAKAHRDLRETAKLLLTAKEFGALSGGVWGSLPDAVQNRLVREAGPVLGPLLATEAKLRRAFSARNLPGYDELERVAVLAGDPGASDGPVAPRTRWSYDPTKRLFIRYNPQGYSRTEVDVYWPERWAVGRDNLRRIVRLADQSGNVIETLYDDTIAPFTHGQAPGLTGYAFSGYRLTRRDPADAAAVQVREIKAPGWTFVGRPGKRTQQGLAGGVFLAENLGNTRAGLRFAVDVGDLKDRFDGWQERYDQANEAMDRWDRINQHFDHQGNDGAIDDLTDMDHYNNGLDAATSQDMFDKGDWIADHLARVVNAWNYCSDALAGLLSNDDADSEARSFDPSDNAAVPTHSGRQRLGQSARSR